MKSKEDSAWGKIVSSIQESDKSVPEIAAEYRQKQPPMTDKFREKCIEESMLTDLMTIYCKELEKDTLLDYNSRMNKFKIEIGLDQEEFENNRQDYVQKFYDMVEKWGLQDKKDLVFVRCKLNSFSKQEDAQSEEKE